MSYPLDLNTLRSIRTLAQLQNFSLAARRVGLSQSAFSRQISTAESRLGLQLFERTNRHVKLTAAGAILLEETATIPNLLKGALRRIDEECRNQTPTIRVGISHEVSLAHLPGIFNSRPDALKLIVSHESTSELQNGLQEARYDLGISIDLESDLDDIRITHRLASPFVLVAPADQPHTPPNSENDSTPWILPPAETKTRALIDRAFPNLSPTLEVASFDLMIHLVALGHGSAFIPQRTADQFSQKHLINEIKLPHPMSHQLIVGTPRSQKTTAATEEFLGQLLLS